MSNVILLVVAMFAAYRLTRLVVSDKISEPVFGRLRAWLERRYIDKHARDKHKRTAMENADDYQSPMAYMLSCFWCAGFWVSGAVTMVLYPLYSIEYPILTWLAMSAVVGLLSKTESE